MDRTRKTSIVVASVALVAMALGAKVATAAPLASSDTDDSLSPASTVVSGHSSTTTFSAGGITVTCTNSVAGGKTPATGLGSIKINPLPTFNDGGTAPCTDNLGGTDTTTVTGKWLLKFLDAKNDEAGTEPNPTGDMLQVTVPKGGAVVHNSLGCTITVAPNANFNVKGKYNDSNSFTVAITNLPISISGGVQCPSATTSTFNATYTFTPGFHDVS